MQSKAKKLALIGLFVALLTVSSVMTKIPMYPVPMTLQTAVILLSAFLAGGVETLIVVAIYVFMGLVGLPVFANGSSGVTYALTPTFGFIIGFALGGLVAGLIAGRKADVTWTRLTVAAIVGTAIFYVVGILYYIGLCLFYTGNAIDMGWILLWFWIIFIPSDLLKGAVAVFVAKKTRPIVVKNYVNADKR